MIHSAMPRPATPRPAPGRSATLVAALLAAALAAVAPALAAKPGETAAPAVPAEPGQTMATFGDWVVRCERPAAPAAAEGASKPPAPPPAPRRVCEAAQALVIKGQQAPVAQIAFGHVPGSGSAEPKGAGDKGAGDRGASDKGAGEKGDAGLTLTVLLPVNISFSRPPRLAGADDKDGATLTLRRCLPGGCLADAKPAAGLLRELRGEAKPAHLSFTDAAERTLTLPFSTRGLAQALDDLARETARDAG